MPNSVPDWPNAAGASVADEYVWYGAWTGGLGVTCSGTDMLCGCPGQADRAVPATVLVWNSPVGGGAVTVNVVCTVLPGPTRRNVAGEVAFTVQPDGTSRPRRTSGAGSGPLLVNVSVAVTGCPPVRLVSPVRLSVAAGGAAAGFRVGVTRIRGTP